MNPTFFEARVDVAGRGIEFSCLVHCTAAPGERLIEREFYEAHGSFGVPTGQHFEMEVIEPKDKPEGVTIHIHLNPHTRRRFVCWANPLPREDQAWNVFTVWCVGTAYSLVYGRDFTPLMKPVVDEFLQFMENEHRVKLTWSKRG